MNKPIFVISIIVGAVIAIALAGAPSAEALQCGRCESEPRVSLPYVEDVNPSGKAYVALVTCCGSAKAEFKATCKGKRVKAHKVGTRAWEVKLRKGAAYKFSVRAKGGKWKSIGYRVY